MLGMACIIMVQCVSRTAVVFCMNARSLGEDRCNICSSVVAKEVNEGCAILPALVSNT